MNSSAVGGRQMQRSGNQHQRQYSSDQLLVDSFPSAAANGGKWLQNIPSSGLSSSQQVEYSRMLRSAQRGMSGEFMIPMESTPPLNLRSSSHRKMGDAVSPCELSPGLLDLHSFDTELLTDISAPGFNDGAATFGYSRERSFDELENNIYSNKQFGKVPPMPDNNISKSFALDKDSPGSVAKIKVVVRKRPLNKKEVSKKEEDIIAIEQHTNSLTVHETKLKVLIVVKTENLETSSCVAGLPQVSFLINGKGVEKRNNVSLDQGPQFPTDISRMLKYGINVLQTIGFFDGTYLIAVAYVSKIFTSAPALKDYVQPVVAALDSDSEIMEGPSRIQLSCPISFKRIKTPVKGHLCKHHQCFDYDNYLEMNSRKPNWRCAYCNQPVCITDLRIDQNMVKILEEAREDVAEVVIHADGSWNVVAEQGDHDVTQVHQTHNMDCETNISKASMTDLVDLTMEEDDICEVTEKVRQDISMDVYGSHSGNLMLEAEDRKPFIDVGGIQVPNVLPNPPQLLNHNSNAAHLAGYHTGNSMHPSFMASYATNGSMVSAGFPQMSNMLGSPGFSDTVSPVFDQTQFNGGNGRNLPSHVDRMTGRIIPSHVDRIPVAVQALPVPSHTHVTSRRVHANVSPRQYLAVNPSTTTLENFNGGNGNMDMQQIARSTADTSGIQDLSQQNPHYVLNEGSLQHMVVLPSTNTPNSRQFSGHRRSPSDLDSYRASAQLSPLSRHSLQTPSPGFRTHHSTGQPSPLPLPSAIRQASFANYGSHRSQPQSPLPPHIIRSPATSPANSLPARDNARVLGTERWRSMTGGGAPSPLSRSDTLHEPSAEPSWRPTGRMRGSLTGSDYSAVISNYMAPLSQPATLGRTPTPSPAPSTSDQVSALVANNLMAHGGDPSS